MSLPYDLIKAESNRVGWPTHYKEDLEIDRQAIDRLIDVCGDDLRFAWGLRELGTHLYQTAQEIVEVSRVFPVIWYYFDGYTLTEMKLIELLEVLEG